MAKKEFLNKEHIIELSKTDDYYAEGRWEHFEEVLNYIKLIDSLNEIGNVLEIGPYRTPFIIDCDVMDIKAHEIPFKINKFIKHDCSKTPFPIEDKAYDLVIASQVLEHLGIYGEQKEVFNEIERISNMAVITLPYDWNVPNFRHHHRIDESVFDSWASKRPYVFQEIHGSQKDRRRILRIYKF